MFFLEKKNKKMFQVTSIPLATSAVVEHNEEVCVKEQGLSQGKDTHGSSPGVNSASGVQHCSASPAAMGCHSLQRVIVQNHPSHPGLEKSGK